MGLKEQVRQRVTIAQEKLFREKAESVARQLGKFSEPSVVVKDKRYFFEEWNYKRGKLHVLKRYGPYGSLVVAVFWARKTVFGERRRFYDGKMEIQAYVPGEDWETALELAYKPIEQVARLKARAAARAE